MRIAGQRVRWVLLVGMVLAATALLLVGQGGRALAAGGQTSVFVTFPNASSCTHTTSPPPVQMSQVLIIGSSPRTMCVWASNVKDPQGLAGFEVDVKYDNELIQFTQATASGTWLASTGRDMPIPPCQPGIIGEIFGDPDGLWHADFTCTSLGQGPPFRNAGPVGNGLLGTFKVQPLATEYAITFIEERYIELFDAGESYDNNSDGDVDDIGIDVIVDRAVIPSSLAMPGSIAVTIAACADFTIAGNPPDGAVAVTDIIQLVQRFGWTTAHPQWDPMYDVKPDGSISVLDIGIAVREYGQLCPT